MCMAEHPSQGTEAGAGVSAGWQLSLPRVLSSEKSWKSGPPQISKISENQALYVVPIYQGSFSLDGNGHLHPLTVSNTTEWLEIQTRSVPHQFPWQVLLQSTSVKI